MLDYRIENTTSKILGELGISSPEEIDIKKIAKHLGVIVKPEKFDSDISGLFVLKKGKAHIRYNSREAKTRKRFTIAHELGHFILHGKNQPLFVDKSEKVMYRDIDSSTGEIKREREANAFAASLLMPKTLIRKVIDNAPKEEKDIASYLAKKFRVSEQAMNFRLANLGFIGLY